MYANGTSKRPLKVSVVIPTYNGAAFLGQAIHSVLNQTHSHLECIVVNDASPDETDAVIAKFDDPRLIYLVHEENRGSDEARITGLEASSGDIIALLDQDDHFHPEKLAVHAAFYEQDPDLGCTFNGRFDVDVTTGRVVGIWRPPRYITLADLVLGFPFGPSDTVMRRDWALREEIWDQSFVAQGEEVIVNGGEIVMYGRLYMAGCKFANVGRVLNYRSYHPGRVLSDLPLRRRSEQRCQEIALDDPRCPPEVRALRTQAFTNTALIWAHFAFCQDENGLGQTFLDEALHLDPSLLQGKPSRLVEVVAGTLVQDVGRPVEVVLNRFFSHLPPGAAHLVRDRDWAFGWCLWQKGLQALMWGDPVGGKALLEKGIASGFLLDEPTLRRMAYELFSYEAEQGTSAAAAVRAALLPAIERAGGGPAARIFQADYHFNRAFHNYRQQEFDGVPASALRAMAMNPRYLLNRGLYAIFFRSLMASRRP